MNSKLSEHLRFTAPTVNADITTAILSPYASAADARRFCAVLTTGTLDASSTATLQLMQATDTKGAGAKPLGSPVIFTAPAGGVISTVVIAEAQVSDLDSNHGYSYLSAMVSSHNATPVPGAVLVITGDHRFDP